jgi:hypothetical protein
MRECPDYAMTPVTSGGALDHKVLRGRTKKTKSPGNGGASEISEVPGGQRHANRIPHGDEINDLL